MDRIGVLLMQLGTPDEPTTEAVRRYLREFLSDPRVIETPRALWWPLLNFVILPRRSAESASKYARIWDSNTGSPLLHITRLQTESLQSKLPSLFVVRFGMRYGRPTIDDAVNEFARMGIDRIIALPMYPQYSAASTASACDRLFQAMQRQRNMPAVRIVPPFFDHPAYIRAQAQILQENLARLTEPPQRIIFSFHGYPLEFVQRGDPYQQHVERTANGLAKALALSPEQWLLTYQSRFQNQVWLEPYTEETVCDLARQGVRRILIASPGFTADCLETIDEVGREIAEEFHKAGGVEFTRCQCLNDHPAWIDAMCELVRNESLGWYESYPKPNSDRATETFARVSGGVSDAQ